MALLIRASIACEAHTESLIDEFLNEKDLDEFEIDDDF